MHIHILGICGTFMGGIANLAHALGYQVTGSDANVYPPMSTQLESLGIELMEGYKPEHLQPQPDLVIIGNALSRGNPAVEYILDSNINYTSGPQWLAENLLKDRWVLAVAGTHGKTTTASMLAWLLEDADLNPGYLIGGIPENFGTSARLGETPFFVVEADEYDTAFFDKRSKFIHYRPRTLVLNNLEFDHADIFEDLEAIQRQFHHLVRTVPGKCGRIITPLYDGNLHDTLDMGCWTPLEYFDPEMEAYWHITNSSADGSAFDVICDRKTVGRVEWDLIGKHNQANALAAIAAARHAGVPPEIAVNSLSRFRNVKRRMELRGEVNDIRLYDDFAHHPTAIETTLEGLRAQVGEERIIAILELRSNTMRMGIHANHLADSLDAADLVFILQPQTLEWDMRGALNSLGQRLHIVNETSEIVKQVSEIAQPKDHLLVMSNGGFDDVHKKLLDALLES